MGKKVLFLCGVWDDNFSPEVLQWNKSGADFAANAFQNKLICGFDEAKLNLDVLSVPFIASYPNNSNLKRFEGFSGNSKFQYVPFNNLWGYRNFSRANSLKRAVKKYILANRDEEILVLLYSAHTPLLKAAKYAKKMGKNVKLCMIVPDLPTHMMLDNRRNIIYDLAKKMDVMSLKRDIKYVDKFVLLTEQMASFFRVEKEDYEVIEGIIYRENNQPSEQNEEKVILYTGTLNEKYGIRDLVDSFEFIDSDKYKLVICGSGDSEEYIKSKASKDNRINYLGQLTPKRVEDERKRADILINPRSNTGEFTKYSFPSKNLEYLLSGKATVAYMLDGMPQIYRRFICEIDPSKPAKLAIAEAIISASSMSLSEQRKKYNEFLEYAERLTPLSVSERILELNKF